MASVAYWRTEEYSHNAPTAPDLRQGNLPPILWHKMEKNAKHGSCYLHVDTDNLRQELYVTSIGCQVHRPGSPYPSAGHPEGYGFEWCRGRVLGDFALILISRGAGTFETRSTRVSCSAGDAILIPPGIWHRYRPDGSTGWYEHWICLNGEFLHRLRSKRRFFGHTIVQRGAANDFVLAAHGRLWDRVRSVNSRNDLALAAAALEVFGLVLQERSENTASAPPTGDLIADAARVYIWYNSHRDLTVGSIADELGVSRRTLERHYASAAGVTLIYDLISRRVECARQLLVETSMSVKEISYTVGFGDSRRLIRNFARIAGETPAAFRAQISSGKRRGQEVRARREQARAAKMSKIIS